MAYRVALLAAPSLAKRADGAGYHPGVAVVVAVDLANSSASRASLAGGSAGSAVGRIVPGMADGPDGHF